ncbi:MAG: hypothetical protein GF317_16225 [Candidatus Lokiarchaeota archaeon]|nr:hypothetical protein [Candidatus Lokiarchaeota archaeon]MBD3201081.1 hypothetical protein [Candidatus Lokiarchaeota archaeon]
MSDQNLLKSDEIEEDTEEKQTTRSITAHRNLQIAGGAIFGALATIVSWILSPLINASRVQGWGFAFFDPTSWVWITCFLIFGPLAGLICSLTGTFGLLFLDPTGIGPAFKFFATIPHILIPIIVLKLWKRKKLTSESLQNPKNYILLGVLSIGLRIVLMLILNFVFFATVWKDFFQYMNLEIIGFENITGLNAVLIFTPILNLYAGIVDLAASYLIVFGPKLNQKFDIW